MRRAFLFACLLVFGSSGCPDDDDSCYTSQDCFDQGLTLTQCIDGTCSRLCESDLDCQYLPGSCAPDDESCKMQLAELMATQFICEEFLCSQGCPDKPCVDGATCFDGRCAYFKESFEPTNDGDFLTLEAMGWNAIERPLKNTRLVVAWSGGADCEIQGDRDRCAGPAADGNYFAVVESTQATSRAPRVLGMTCRDCSCCLACRDPLARTSTTSPCPGLSYPEVNACTMDVPGACQAVCDSCAQCPNELSGVVQEAGLNACELVTAAKSCDACLLYDQCLLDKQAENRPCPGDANTYPECTDGVPGERTQADCDRCLLAECKAFEDDCLVCRKAASLKTINPDEPELWKPLENQCKGLGAAACYEVPKSSLRTDLTPDEQALESPAIDLSAAKDKSLILQFEFIAFDLGREFIRVIQGEPESVWPKEVEKVTVQICKGACDEASNWQDAIDLDSKQTAFMPSSDEKLNGILYAEQNQKDWVLHRRQIEIPADFATKEFHVRFVPTLSPGARLGIDNIQILETK